MTFLRIARCSAAILAVFLLAGLSRAGAEEKPLSIEIFMATDKPTKGAREMSIVATKTPVYVLGKPILTAADVTEFRLLKGMGKNMGATLVLTEEAAKTLHEVMVANPGKHWATLIDGRVVNSYTYSKTAGSPVIVKWPLANGGISHEEWNELVARFSKPAAKSPQK